MKTILGPALFGAVLLAGAASAQTAPAPAASPAARGPNLLDKAINTPGTNWSIYGAGQKSKLGATTGVPGNQAMRVDVAAKGANAWDVGALSPIQKPIVAGTTLLVAVYLRAPALKEGETLPIAFFGATEAAAPYGNIVGSDVTIGNAWKLYYASGKAARAFAPGAARVSVQLAGAKASVELGPVFVLDFGVGYDPARLPKN